MSPSDTELAAELFDDFIKNEWQDMFRKDVDVKLDNGSRYVPNGGAQGVQLLRKNVNAFTAAIRLWSGPVEKLKGPKEGYDRIVDQAGVEYTWEWFLVDKGRPWASAVPAEVRERVEADLERRKSEAGTHRAAREAGEKRVADEATDRVIATMNAKRVDDGKDPLTEDQELSVRETRQGRAWSN